MHNLHFISFCLFINSLRLRSWFHVSVDLQYSQLRCTTISFADLIWHSQPRTVQYHDRDSTLGCQLIGHCHWHPHLTVQVQFVIILFVSAAVVVMLQLDVAPAPSLTIVAALAYQVCNYHLMATTSILCDIVSLDFVIGVHYLLVLRSCMHLCYRCIRFHYFLYLSQYH